MTTPAVRNRADRAPFCTHPAAVCRRSFHFLNPFSAFCAPRRTFRATPAGRGSLRGSLCAEIAVARRPHFATKSGKSSTPQAAMCKNQGFSALKTGLRRALAGLRSKFPSHGSANPSHGIAIPSHGSVQRAHTPLFCPCRAPWMRPSAPGGGWPRRSLPSALKKVAATAAPHPRGALRAMLQNVRKRRPDVAI